MDALVSTMGAAFVEPIVPTLLSFWKTAFSIGGVFILILFDDCNN